MQNRCHQCDIGETADMHLMRHVYLYVICFYCACECMKIIAWYFCKFIHLESPLDQCVWYWSNCFPVQLIRFIAWGIQWQYYKIIRWKKNIKRPLQWIARIAHIYKQCDCVCVRDSFWRKLHTTLWIANGKYQFEQIFKHELFGFCMNNWLHKQDISLENRVLRWPFSCIANCL